jgi:hypothetical protein
MSKRFARNITTGGRVLRGLIGLALLGGGFYALTEIVWLGVVLLLSAAFVLFEAIRGWCGLRACGIKTRI